MVYEESFLKKNKSRHNNGKVYNDEYEYDIDELEDFSTEGLYERYHETDPDNEEEDYLGGDMGNVFNDVDDDILPDLTAKLQESWDMFERFKKSMS